MPDKRKEMTPKQFLQRAYNIHTRIKAKEEQIQLLRYYAERATSTTTAERVSGTSQRSKVEDTVGKIVDIQKLIQKDINRLVKIYTEVKQAIDAVENDQYRQLLELRYLNYLTWEQIANEMNYSYMHVHRLHGGALQEINKML